VKNNPNGFAGSAILFVVAQQAAPLREETCR
jgi:hypothetical protein